MCMKSLTKKLSKGFQSISEGHKYADTRQLLSSFKFLPAAKIKQTMLKIVVIENQFALQINHKISMFLITALGFEWSHL